MLGTPSLHFLGIANCDEKICSGNCLQEPGNKRIKNAIIHKSIYRVSCKKIYPTLKVNIQRFLSTKIIKRIQI